MSSRSTDIMYIPKLSLIEEIIGKRGEKGLKLLQYKWLTKVYITPEKLNHMSSNIPDICTKCPNFKGLGLGLGVGAWPHSLHHLHPANRTCHQPPWSIFSLLRRRHTTVHEIRSTTNCSIANIISIPSTHCLSRGDKGVDETEFSSNKLFQN